MSQNSQSASISLGFLTVIQESTGWVGGYLVTNGWGRPLEFRLTTAVQPNRIQATLYGPTLNEYLVADLIGKTLIDKTATKPELIVTDAVELLALRSRLEIPVVALRTQQTQGETHFLEHARSSSGLFVNPRFRGDLEAVPQLLDRIDPAVDVNEPFTRIREAIAEARKMGVNSRAA